MPRSSPYTLLWSEDHQHYELHLRGQLHQCFPPGECDAFSRWLSEQTSFAFVGQAGWLSVIKEARAAGAGYWYAYRTQDSHTRKRYLGPTAKVTFARLEEAATQLTQTPASNEPARSTASQQQTFLSIKLVPPRVPKVLVDRPRLLRDLDAICTHPLTLVSASAGSGKTTLLATWVAGTSQRLARISQIAGSERGESELVVAWLSLDELENEPRRFWASCMAALQTRLPAIGHEALALLQTPEAPPLATILTMLLNELKELRQEVVLILDDYHVIEQQAIAESMLFFLAHLPSNLHLVFATRVDPDLPLASFRVRGQLLEIRDRDLQFSQEEAASFLRQATGHPLSEEEIAILQSHTEGWIAGLQLAALSLSRREDVSAWVSDFGGAHRFVLDYVQQDILAGLPVTLQHFLLQTSILTRMNAAACQAIMAGPDLASCQRLLEEVERANLFVVPLDDERQWYRYHDLFREALLARLYTRQPELVPLLHTRAARFYEVQGEWAEAIAHALAAPDYPLAASLMEQTVEQFWLHGEAETMARWVLALPEPIVREHVRLVLTTAYYLRTASVNTAREQRTRVHQEMRQLMARVETALRRERDELDQGIASPGGGAGAVSRTEGREARLTEHALLHHRLRRLRMFLVLNEAIASEDFERLSNMQQEIEEELERDEEVAWQIIPLSCAFILHYTFRQEGASLVPQLLAAYERASREASRYATHIVGQWLAMAAVEAGRLHLAYEESLAALDLIKQLAGYALLKGYVEMALAQVFYQWNRLVEARDLLHTMVHDAVAWQQLDLLSWGHAGLIQVELARGDRPATELALHELERLVQHERFGFYPGWLPTLRAQWWLAQGQVREASDWAASIVFPEEPWDRNLYDAFPVVIRVYFAQQRWKEALELLERCRGHLDRPANIRITLTYLAQSLVALHQAGKSEQARGVAARLVALTEPEGYLRVYLDEGELMKEALQAWLTFHSEHQPQASYATAYVSRLLAAFEQQANRASTSPEVATLPDPLPSSVPQPSQAASTLGTSLTRREQEVLRLLVAGQTYAEMAEALVVSPNTIKTQVSSIYRKLDVRNRLQASAAAQRLRLL